MSSLARSTPPMSDARSPSSVLTVAMMICEIVGGLVFGSMALIADGLHMSTHAAALGVSAFAYHYARRHAEDPRFAFGTGKVGDLAAFASGLALAIVALFIGYESLERFFAPEPIHYTEALALAALGLAVNVASAWLLRDSHDHSHGHDHGHDHVHDHSHAAHDHDHDDMIIARRPGSEPALGLCACHRRRSGFDSRRRRLAARTRLRLGLARSGRRPRRHGRHPELVLWAFARRRRRSARYDARRKVEGGHSFPTGDEWRFRQRSASVARRARAIARRWRRSSAQIRGRPRSTRRDWPICRASVM